MGIVALLAGGGAGALSRYLVSLLVFGAAGGWLPWGTLAVNLSGCFLIGLLDALATRRGFGGPHGRVMLLSGFCGAYTTFSTLIFELDALLRASPLRAGLYLAVSVVAGLLLFRVGTLAGS